MPRILVYEPAFRRIESHLSELGGQGDYLLLDKDGVIRLNGAVVSAEDANPDAAWASADLFYTPAAGPFFGAVMKSANLKWVQSAAAGFENAIFARMVEKGAQLTTNHSQAVGMSEYVLWGVLDHFQHGRARRTEQDAKRWTTIPFREISDSRWLIVGFGAIGQAVAQRANAFGAHITGVRRTPGDHDLADSMVPLDQIVDHLGEADVVVLSLPLNAASANMVDAKFLAAMKPGSMLVNVGRGGLVDEDALLAALDAGTPEHALLDVFRTEPLPADSRFWTHPRVTLTPHASPVSSGLEARSDELFLDNLGRYLTGQPLLNAVDSKEVLAGAGG